MTNSVAMVVKEENFMEFIRMYSNDNDGYIKSEEEEQASMGVCV